MPLTLSLTGQGANGPLQEIRSLDRGTLSLGRGPQNDWVLHDPAAQLSKLHCTIACMGGRYILTDLSTNGVFLNGAMERMPRDSQVVLADGDEFRLGDYVVRVSEAGPAAVAFAAPPAGLPAADPLALDPFGDPSEMPAAGGFSHPMRIETPLPRGLDPFDTADEQRPVAPEFDRFQGQAADPSWSGASQRDNVDAANQFYAPPRVVVQPMLSDADLDDLLGDLPPGPGAAPPSQPPVTALGMSPPSLPADIDFDDLLGDLAPGASAPVPIAPPLPAVGPVASLPQPAAPAAPVPAPPEVEANPFDEPGRPGRALPVAAPVVPAAPPIADAPETAARLLAAFLEGAGNPKVDVSAQDAEAYFRLVGELMKTMVESLRDVLMSRAEVKRGFGIEQTMLQARNNNALKFSVTPEDAVAAILQPSRPGYLPPLKATDEAFRDLRSHQMAVMAGVQAALVALLRRFDPAAIEARITGAGLLGSLLPGSRKSRTWEMFCATYEDIAREAEEDFQAVFGREFAKAYQEQERKL
ncbi:phosphopeptide-binding protein [Siccirubricoccus deserti]|uniref:Type VI secretion system-associated FHA domain protein TagH n=1 Tax=Siccirubricoccus deserti TaxID=2013562 RepID=A0A9X0QUZ6_9PROT|nr:type VI secretion system-associated FHA domain protein TagH [Siccirubricoccus deserti]MBC4013748.1 type VI secretion system-associated FHA domain protein TagH [Siccirubricoccus deserti]GGC29173.1 phosphopeptide-binding protein [Siccirubricoccus deserti]